MSRSIRAVAATAAVALLAALPAPALAAAEKSKPSCVKEKKAYSAKTKSTSGSAAGRKVK